MELKINDLYLRSEELNCLILDNQRKILKLRDNILKATIQSNNEEKLCMLHITSMKDANGKLVYSNAESRSAALNEMLKPNKLYNDAQETITRHQTEINEVQLIIDFQLREISYIKATLYAIGGK